MDGLGTVVGHSSHRAVTDIECWIVRLSSENSKVYSTKRRI